MIMHAPYDNFRLKTSLIRSRTSHLKCMHSFLPSMEHAHLSHAHLVLLQMSLTPWSKLEPKKFMPKSYYLKVLSLCYLWSAGPTTIVNFGEGFKLLCQVCLHI